MCPTGVLSGDDDVKNDKDQPQAPGKEALELPQQQEGSAEHKGKAEACSAPLGLGPGLGKPSSRKSRDAGVRQQQQHGSIDQQAGKAKDSSKEKAAPAGLYHYLSKCLNVSPLTMLMFCMQKAEYKRLKERE